MSFAEPFAESEAESKPDSAAKDHKVIFATDLLAYDEGQLVQYLKEHDRGQTFDISSLEGVISLSASQREDLAQRIIKAAKLLPLNLDELQTRLQHVADTQGDSHEFRLSRQGSESIAGTPPSTELHELEKSCHEELTRDGCRPACSIQEMSLILAAPMARFQAVRSWLSDEPDTDDGAGEIETIFSRQFRQWWTFRKSQWDSRGLDNSEAGASAFVEASRRKYKGVNYKAMVSGPSFEETTRRIWQYLPALPELPEDRTFSAYSSAVKMRLAPYHFTAPLQLKKNPQKQTAWTDWLEYLSFELRYLERLTLVAEPLDIDFDQAIRKLLGAKQSDGNKAASSSAASVPVQARQRGKATLVAEELAAARADRDASQRAIDDFIRETVAYTKAHRMVFYQRQRVEWAVKVAHLMETEMSLHRNAAKIKKRKQRDEEEPSEPQSKITTRGDGRGSASSVAVPGMPHPRLSTLRSARRTRAKD